MKRIALQGIENSYHDIAASKYFDSYDILSCDTFREVFEKIDAGKADYGVVAIENSIYGSINDVYDLLQRHHFWITAEIDEKISQCLMGTKESNINDILEVHSHNVALAQCDDFLTNNLPAAKRIRHYDTAAAAKDIMLWDDKTKAAIASKDAASDLGLKLLAEGIETNSQNYTRFVVLSKQKEIQGDEDKTSLVLETIEDTKPGALYKALGAFDKNNINLTLLLSRPVLGKKWHYHFYVDVEAGINDDRLERAMSELDKINYNVKVLGSYKSAS